MNSLLLKTFFQKKKEVTPDDNYFTGAFAFVDIHHFLTVFGHVTLRLCMQTLVVINYMVNKHCAMNKSMHEQLHKSLHRSPNTVVLKTCDTEF